MNKPLVDIVIPSFNNIATLSQCVRSIFLYTGADYRITVINNGDHHLHFDGLDTGEHQSLDPGKNLGWTDAINWARDKTDAPYFLMLNDDVVIPDHDYGWLHRMLLPMREEKVAAVGPLSNYVMGMQSIMNSSLFSGSFQRYIVPVLSGFCLLVKREALDEVDWIDPDFQHGAEDVDLCIKLRQAGYELAVARDIFIYHYGSQTAEKVYGDWWNSNLYSLEQRMKILRKYGLREYQDLMKDSQLGYVKEEDTSRETIKRLIKPSMNGLDLGCGTSKIHENATGVDLIEDKVGHGRYRGQVSKSDVRADITKGLPFDDNSQDYVVCSHVIEHISDTVSLLREISRVLRPGGLFLATMPSQSKIDVVPIDPTHVHGYTPEAFSNLIESLEIFEIQQCEDVSPGYNFLTVSRKPQRVAIAV